METDVSRDEYILVRRDRTCHRGSSYLSSRGSITAAAPQVSTTSSDVGSVATTRFLLLDVPGLCPDEQDQQRKLGCSVFRHARAQGSCRICQKLPCFACLPALLQDMACTQLGSCASIEILHFDRLMDGGLAPADMHLEGLWATFGLCLTAAGNRGRI